MKKINNNDTEQDVELFSLKDFFKLLLIQWKWILVSVIFFTGLSLFYLARKEPVYSRSMEILVKDQEAGGGMSDISNTFSQLGLVSSNTKVYNELIAFTSPAVMYEVVERLDLTMNYNLKKGMHPNTLYHTSNPFKVDFEDLGVQDVAGLRLIMYPNGNYEISKLWLGTPSGREKYKGTFKGTKNVNSIKTPLGKIKVYDNPEYIPNPELEGETLTIIVFKNGLQLTVESYLKKLKGDLTDQDADVINLQIDDVSVQRANDILTTIVQVYNERWIEDKNKIAVATSKFITERLGLIEQELGQVDTEITDYKSDIKVPDIYEVAKGLVEQDFKMNEEITKQTSLLAMSTFLKDYLMDPKNKYSILPMNTGTDNQVLEQQISHYNEKLLTRNNLAKNSSESNPIVKDMDTELDGMRRAILQSTNSQIANLSNAIKNMTNVQSQTKQELASSPRQANILLSAERKQLVMQELYLFLLQKREETELSQSFAADNTRIITPPYGSLKPVSPKKFLTILIAFFFGLAIPAVALFIAESSNTKIRSKKDLDNIPVPFTGEIPFVGRKKNLLHFLRSKKKKLADIEKPKIVVFEGNRDIPNEAFRVVRSNIDFMLGKNGNVTVFALTSFNPGSGKSFVAFNLGASFAIKGKRVLIIDGDLRHGSISSYINSPKRGLTNYLIGNSDDWETLVKQVPETKNLYILPIGHRPPNPAELLENGRLETLMEEAKGLYDIILIDCPPVNIVVDTQIINKIVDRTIFVVRAGLLEKSAIKELVDLYEEKKLKNISVLLNGTKTEFSSYHTYGNYEAMDYDKA